MLFGATVHLPRQRSLRELQGQIHTLEQNLAQTQERCGALTPLTREVAELRAAATVFEARLPQDGQVGPFLQQVAEHLRQAQLQSVEMRPAAPVECSRYTELPIKLEFQGPFAGVFGFLAQLEAMDRTKRIVGLNLTGDVGQGNSVRADVVLSVFCTKG